MSASESNLGGTATLGLVETEQPVKPISPVNLPTRRDHSLVVQAIEHRLDGLTKLAKKATDEGYPSLARTVDADASALREIALPQFREQQEIPFATPADVVAALENLLHNVVHEVPSNAKGEARDHEIVLACARRAAEAVAAAAEWRALRVQQETAADLEIVAVGAEQFGAHTLHDWRHTHSVQLVKLGYSEQIGAAHLGHRNTDQFRKRYSVFKPDRLDYARAATKPATMPRKGVK